MKTKFILAFTWFYGYSNIKRAPVYIIAYLSLPLSLLFFIYVISKGELINYGILGGLISVIVSNSISLIGDFTFMRLQLRLQDLLVATEIGPIDYIIGLTLGNFIYSLPGLILYIILGLIFKIFNIIQLIIILVILAVLLFSTTALSITLASLIRHTRHSWGISTFMSLLFTILPPLYYPFSVLPKWALDILYISPATSASVFIQGFLNLQNLNLYSIAIFIIESAILLSLPLYVMKWREN
ncbi:ABC transporter permease [Acidianus manzaensis]|uniref:Daunorubicin ABC transporter ATP-binding protein n=1 Tax=Acidianus manzaensis TaxID=282676 RepID=A0A1W6JY48_9CREN|nr:ABC transporter permease [Acidianus manzaensis]ARM75189.1 daunorubicin ABC transporter ATP-binding protein [Acidianus manzaensis]